MIKLVKHLYVHPKMILLKSTHINKKILNTEEIMYIMFFVVFISL